MGSPNPLFVPLSGLGRGGSRLWGEDGPLKELPQVATGRAGWPLVAPALLSSFGHQVGRNHLQSPFSLEEKPTWLEMPARRWRLTALSPSLRVPALRTGRTRARAPLSAAVGSARSLPPEHRSASSSSSSCRRICLCPLPPNGARGSGARGLAVTAAPCTHGEGHNHPGHPAPVSTSHSFHCRVKISHFFF